MWWTDPVWLLALLALVPVVRFGWRRGECQARLSPSANVPAADSSALRRLTWFRGVSLTLAVLALAGTSVIWPARLRRVAVLLDVSASVGRAQVEVTRREIGRAHV